MIHIVFKNVEPSDLAKDTAIERVQTIVDRFPDLKGHRLTATLSMENSPTQAGPDVFSVKILITGKRYKSIVLEKSESTLYLALAEVVGHALERLNRYGDKARVKRIHRARKSLPILSKIQETS